MNIDFPNFSPHLLCPNGHVQTVFSVYVPTKYIPIETTPRRVPMHDGDEIVVHENQSRHWKTGDRIAIMVHGLCGCHASQYMMRISTKLVDVGYKTVRCDLRGFGSSQLVSRGHTHAGCSDDIEAVLEDVMAGNPGSPITLIGFSLGANISLKLLCEYENDVPSALDSAVVVSPPTDLVACAKHLRKGLNRFYDLYFANLLKRVVWRRRNSGIPLNDVPLRRLPNRLYDFDNLYTAPAAGFADADEYYEMCSTHTMLDRVSIPTLMLVSRDDPIVPIDVFDKVKTSPMVKKLETKRGGHLGFFSSESNDPDRRWMDWRILEWVQNIDQRNSVS